MAGVLIVANGAWPKSFKIDEVFAEYEHVLALDGAANRMVDAGIVPTAIIGDLDSIDNTTLEHCKANGSLVIHTPNQEQSDVAKGLHWAEKTYPNEQIDLIGIELGRYDHNLAAYSALFECNTSARILMDGWSALRVNSIPNRIQVRKGAIVSLIPFGNVTGVSLQGCEYSLENASMSTGTQGVSNKAIDATIVVSAQSGDLLLLFER
tara:strand:+ start:730 stop:1353 length:624 start_codon:yes stop_codon:yes gene_type:complete